MTLLSELGWLLRVVGLFCAAVKIAASASFNVSPIGFELTAEKATSVLKIQNIGEESVRIQVQALAWSTDGIKELLSVTDALLLNPPIFSIAPGQTQYLRFGLRRPESPAVEKGYRLILDEVPRSGPQAPGIQTRLQISIPVFLSPKFKQQKLSWQLTRLPKGRVLTVSNDGSVHSKIINVSHLDAYGRPIAWVNTPTYVLPGQRKEWVLDERKIPAGELRLRIQTDKGESEELLTLEAEPVSGR